MTYNMFGGTLDLAQSVQHSCLHPGFHCHSFHLLTEGWPGWVDVGGWLNTNMVQMQIEPTNVTRHSTNLALTRASALIETNGYH